MCNQSAGQNTLHFTSVSSCNSGHGVRSAGAWLHQLAVGPSWGLEVRVLLVKVALAMQGTS